MAIKLKNGVTHPITHSNKPNGTERRGATAVAIVMAGLAIGGTIGGYLWGENRGYLNGYGVGHTDGYYIGTDEGYSAGESAGYESARSIYSGSGKRMGYIEGYGDAKRCANIIVGQAVYQQFPLSDINACFNSAYNNPAF
jgi:hypothetical protein